MTHLSHLSHLNSFKKVQRLQLLDVPRLRRFTFSALQASLGPTANTWAPLLRVCGLRKASPHEASKDLVTQLTQKIFLQPAEETLRLCLHFLKAMVFKDAVLPTCRSLARVASQRSAKSSSYRHAEEVGQEAKLAKLVSGH